MTEREIFVLKNRLIPQPRSVEFHDGADCRIADGTRFTLECPFDTAAAFVAKTAQAYWNAAPAVRVIPGVNLPQGESYRLKVTTDEIIIAAAEPAGLRYAMQTLRQLAEPQRCVREFSYYLAQPCTIDDTPAMPFRGVHICWFPESKVWQIEKQIRLAAYYKFNHIVMETWGVFPFESAPELCWPGCESNRAELKRLIELARELGITMIPQLNLLGHGSASRTSTGKHVYLYRRPELESLMEQDGWSWCLSNPETRKLLTAAVLELHEFYGRPAYFHIGCDEAYNMASCAVCRRADLQKLLKDHLCYFHDLFAKRDTRIMMWHDMLISYEDPRFKGYIACGVPIDNLGNLYKELPRDIVIADWQYGYPEKDGKEPEWLTSKFFKDSGFDVMVCPWLEGKGTLSLGKFAAKEKLMGMLATTWHHVSGHEMQAIYLRGANSSWNTVDSHPWNDIHSSCNYHIRQISQDAGLTGYEESGTSMLQVDAVGIPG